MKWLIILAAVSLYLAGMTRLANVAMAQFRQIESVYVQAANHPDELVEKY